MPARGAHSAILLQFRVVLDCSVVDLVIKVMEENTKVSRV